MRPRLVFPDDTRTHNLTDEFLFGPSLLICPITEPMLYAPGSRPLHNLPHSRSVYLPRGADWYCFHSGSFYRGGQTITADAPLDHIPVFARAGSILPMTDVMQYTDENPTAPWHLHIYPGTDATFTLYEDAGDSYAYERGECSRIRLHWNDATHTFNFATRQGTFPNMTTQRACILLLHDAESTTEQAVQYTGDELHLTFPSLT